MYNNNKIVILVTIICIFITGIVLISCAPQPVPNSLTPSTSKQTTRGVTIEMYYFEGFGRAWKLTDSNNGAVCYGNAEGGIVCNFK
jgi:hypothetical protein